MGMDERWRNKGSLEEIVRFMYDGNSNFPILGYPPLRPDKTSRPPSIVFDLRAKSSALDDERGYAG